MPETSRSSRWTSAVGQSVPTMSASRSRSAACATRTSIRCALNGRARCTLACQATRSSAACRRWARMCRATRSAIWSAWGASSIAANAATIAATDWKTTATTWSAPTTAPRRMRRVTRWVDTPSRSSCTSATCCASATPRSNWPPLRRCYALGSPPTRRCVTGTSGPGKKVGVVGIGGLGHMGIKLAHAMGAHVVAFTTSESKREAAQGTGRG